MNQSDWRGVMPAITTPFTPDLSVDHAFLSDHVSWLIDNGCTGIVSPGSLGEGATLTLDEKRAMFQTIGRALGGRAPLIAAVSALSTTEAIAFAKTAEQLGCHGLMILPPYVYKGDEREMEAHVTAVIKATNLSCMLYNNPIAYGTDFRAEQIARLAEVHPNLHAVKESSGDARRFIAIHEAVGDRLNVFVGMDDMIVEGVTMGAVGWIAGLVNALPRESVRVYEQALAGDLEGVRALYECFLPLLRLDTVPKFVQLIKLVQQEVGRGSERVRPPRLELVGEEREQTLALIRKQLDALSGAFRNVPSVV
jgi:1-pyrroline-4-hydroxy-2-carboxylate deaminase